MKYGIPRLENICPRQSAQKGVVFFGECGWFYSLTLPRKNVKVIETKKHDEENQYALCPSVRELPFGARQQKICAEFLSEWLC